MHLVPIQETGTTHPSVLAAGSVAAEVVAATVALYSRRGYEVPWIGYLAVEGTEFIGGCGFAGPARCGEVEIAYFTFPGKEGRGVATEMARELIRISRNAATQAGIRFIAHTLPEESASTSVLRKLGFSLEGAVLHPEDGTVWKWSERERSEA
ncbi:MAG: GNAT family N-acetyltransferase [Usitatibacteraceae bacterium]